MKLGAGIHADVPMGAYIADPAPEPSLSTGVIEALIQRSPAHARHEHPRLGDAEDDSTARSDLGSAAHAKVLGGEEAVLVVDAPDWRTKAAREARDAARAQGRIPVLAHNVPQLDAIAQSALRALASAGISLAGARAEHTLIWQDDGVWCRSRPDLICESPLYVVDLKTCENADPSSWIRRSLLPGGYHLQAAHALRGLDLLGEPTRDFVFLVVEIEPPYAASLVGVGPALLDLAQRQCAVAREKWLRCLSTGEWPAYPGIIHWAEPPAYLEWDWETRRAVEHGREAA